MTWNSPHHLPPQTPAPDPLTDSGVRRAIGTQVRLHLPEGRSLDVGLLDIRDVATWTTLAMMIHRRLPIQIDGPIRAAFAGGVVMWVEEIRDE